MSIHVSRLEVRLEDNGPNESSQATRAAHGTTPGGAIQLPAIIDFFSYWDNFLVRSRARAAFKILHKAAKSASGGGAPVTHNPAGRPPSGLLVRRVRAAHACAGVSWGEDLTFLLACFWLKLGPQSLGWGCCRNSGLMGDLGLRRALLPVPPPVLSRLYCHGQGHQAAGPALRGPSPFPLPQNVKVQFLSPQQARQADTK